MSPFKMAVRYRLPDGTVTDPGAIVHLDAEEGKRLVAEGHAEPHKEPAAIDGENGGTFDPSEPIDLTHSDPPSAEDKKAE